MGALGINSWGKLVRSPWRLSIWATGIPLVVATGLYMTERLDDHLVDKGYAATGRTACASGTWVEGPWLFTADDVRDRRAGDPRCPQVYSGGAAVDPQVFTAYIGDSESRMYLHQCDAESGFRFGRAVVGVVGIVGPDGVPVVRTFCVSSEDHIGYSGTAEYGGGNIWGRDFGPPWDIQAFLSSPSGNPLVIPREEVGHAQAWMGTGSSALLPQGCSIQPLEPSGIEGGQSSCSSQDCRDRHVVHESRRLAAWLGEHGAR